MVRPLRLSFLSKVIMNTILGTNISHENPWLEDEFPFGQAYFQGRTVSFRECSFHDILCLNVPQCFWNESGLDSICIYLLSICLKYFNC